MKNIDLKKILFILLVICVMPLSVKAAEFELKSVVPFSEHGGYIERILPSFDDFGKPDGYLYFFRDFYNHKYKFLKFDFNGNIIYCKEFDLDKSSPFDNITAETIDENNTDYKSNGSSDLLITVQDDNSNILLKKQLGGNGDEAFSCATYSYNDNGIQDGYLIAIQTSSSDLGVNPGYVLVKLNMLGKVVWNVNIDNFSSYLGSPTIMYSENNKLLSIFIFEGSNILKCDYTSGEIVFNIDVGFNVVNIYFSYDKNGVIDGIIVCGTDNISKYNLDGNLVFTKEIKVKALKVNRLTDGTVDGYIVAFYLDITSNIDLNIAKYDLDFNLIYNTIYDAGDYLRPFIFDSYNSNGKVDGFILTVNSADCSTLEQLKYEYPMFEISKTSSDEGTILVDNEAIVGETVKINVYPKDGYFVKRIIVKDESGKEIEVSNDGTFVMPEGKVTVSAIYERITNPDTASAVAIVIGMFVLIGASTYIVSKSRRVNN